jgi:hypothetical protein
MIRYYWFRICWLYKHRHWADTRQKYKRMEKDWQQKNCNNT